MGWLLFGGFMLGLFGWACRPRVQHHYYHPDDVEVHCDSGGYDGDCSDNSSDNSYTDDRS